MNHILLNSKRLKQLPCNQYLIKKQHIRTRIENKIKMNRFKNTGLSIPNVKNNQK